MAKQPFRLRSARSKIATIASLREQLAEEKAKSENWRDVASDQKEAIGKLTEQNHTLEVQRNALARRLDQSVLVAKTVQRVMGLAHTICNDARNASNSADLAKSPIVALAFEGLSARANKLEETIVEAVNAAIPPPLRRREPFSRGPRRGDEEGESMNAPVRKIPSVAYAIECDRLPVTRALARAFIHVVRMRLTPEQLLEVRLLNDEERDSFACHTFDFIDAEKAMHDAVRSIGLVPSSAKELETREADRRMAVNLEHAAWSLAKQARFSEDQIR